MTVSEYRSLINDDVVVGGVVGDVVVGGVEIKRWQQKCTFISSSEECSKTRLEELESSSSTSSFISFLMCSSKLSVIVGHICWMSRFPR